MANETTSSFEHYRKHPIYLKPEDMDKLPEDLLERIRSTLADARGQLGDVRRAMGWSESIQTAEEGVTLVISYLHGVIKDMERSRAREAAQPPR